MADRVRALFMNHRGLRRFLGALVAVLPVALVLTTGVPPAAAGPFVGNVSFTYSGGDQYWTIPLNTTQLVVTSNGASGAGGGSGIAGDPGGSGGVGYQFVTTVPVGGASALQPGDQLQVFVGGQGDHPSCPCLPAAVAAAAVKRAVMAAAAAAGRPSTTRPPTSGSTSPTAVGARAPTASRATTVRTAARATPPATATARTAAPGDPSLRCAPRRRGVPTTAPTAGTRAPPRRAAAAVAVAVVVSAATGAAPGGRRLRRRRRVDGGPVVDISRQRHHRRRAHRQRVGLGPVHRGDPGRPDHHQRRQHHLHHRERRDVHRHHRGEHVAHRRALRARRPAERRHFRRQRQWHGDPGRHPFGGDRRDLCDQLRSRQHGEPAGHPELHPDRRPGAEASPAQIRPPSPWARSGPSR